MSSRDFVAGVERLPPLLKGSAALMLLDLLMKLYQIAPMAYDDIRKIELRFLEMA